MRGLKESGIVQSHRAERWKRTVDGSLAAALLFRVRNERRQRGAGYHVRQSVCLDGAYRRTGKPVEVGVVGIIKFENGKVNGTLYWDQASVLEQLGSYVHRLAETGARNRQEARWHEC